MKNTETIESPEAYSFSPTNPIDDDYYDSERVRPNITVITLPREIMEEELKRQLMKKDCRYKIVVDEEQVYVNEVEAQHIRKVVLFSDKKWKFKVLVFI